MPTHLRTSPALSTSRAILCWPPRSTDANEADTSVRWCKRHGGPVPRCTSSGPWADRGVVADNGYLTPRRPLELCVPTRFQATSPAKRVQRRRWLTARRTTTIGASGTTVRRVTRAKSKRLTSSKRALASGRSRPTVCDTAGCSAEYWDTCRPGPPHAQPATRAARQDALVASDCVVYSSFDLTTRARRGTLAPLAI